MSEQAEKPKVKKKPAIKIKHTDTLEQLNEKIQSLEISLEVTKSMRNIAQKKIEKKQHFIKKSVKR